jgi:uncharacterized membrane protein
VDTQRGFERLVNFSDAVVAIAATLLILPLADLVERLGRQPVRDILDDHRSDLLAFALSFVVVYQLWLLHHRLFRGLRGYNEAVIWTNLVWLLSIVFLPFATKLIARGDGFEAGTSALYIGTIAVAVSTILVQRIIVARNPDLEFDDVRGTTRVLPAAVATAIVFAALVLAVVFPAVGLWFLLLFVVTGPVTVLVERRRAPQVAANGPVTTSEE